MKSFKDKVAAITGLADGSLTEDDFADWVEPRLVGAKGELKLTDLKWTAAVSGWGKVNVNANCEGHPLRIAGQVSSLISHTRPDIPPPTTWPARTAFPIANPNVSGVFQASPSPSRLAAVSPPNRVRHPTDRLFAFSCSPPPLARTQLLSANGFRSTHEGTCTLPNKQPCRRTSRHAPP